MEFVVIRLIRVLNFLKVDSTFTPQNEKIFVY